MNENGLGLPTPTELAPPLEALKHEIQQTVESFIELGVLVHDYPDEANSRQALEHQLNAVVRDLAQVSKVSADLKDVVVPLDILDYIDAGRNPDIYSREFIELVVKQNQFIHGKMTAMAQFRDVLIEGLSAAFPEIAGNLEDARTATSKQ